MNFTIYEPEVGDLVSFCLLESPKNKANEGTRILLVLDPAVDQVLDESGVPATVNLRFTSANPWIKEVTVVRAGSKIIDYVNNGIPSKGLIRRDQHE